MLSCGKRPTKITHSMRLYYGFLLPCIYLVNFDFVYMNLVDFCSQQPNCVTHEFGWLSLTTNPNPPPFPKKHEKGFRHAPKSVRLSSRVGLRVDVWQHSPVGAVGNHRIPLCACPLQLPATNCGFLSGEANARVYAYAWHSLCNTNKCESYATTLSLDCWNVRIYTFV